MSKKLLLERYDEDCVEAASDLWATLQETPTHMQHGKICEALKEYSCEHDKRLTSDQWAQQYREACEKLGEVYELVQAIRESDCEPFLPIQVRERLQTLFA